MFYNNIKHFSYHMIPDNPSHAAVHTIAAFAIKSKPDQVPTSIDEIHKEPVSEHQNLVPDALKQLHQDEIDFNAG